MTKIRKHLLWTLPLLALAPLASQAAPPAAPPVNSIDCDHQYISQRDAARVLHTDNFSQTYAKRQSLYANVARLCQGGFDRVLLVTSEPKPEPQAARKLATR